MRLRLLFKVVQRWGSGTPVWGHPAISGDASDEQRDRLPDKRLPVPSLLDHFLLSSLKYFRGRFIFS